VTGADSELRRLRARLAEMTDEAANNERILKRSQQREMALLQAVTLPALLDHMVGGLQDSFKLDAVTLLLEDPSHEIRHLLLAAERRPADCVGVAFVDTLFGMAPQLANLRRPWLGRFVPADHQLLFPGSAALGSIALLPLIWHQELVGSLNLGSTDATRFTRHHGTDFLAHLGVVAGFALENTLNRARLVRSGLTDTLTGWHNRRYLKSRLAEELSRSSRQSSPLTCLMIDVDYFKQVNDRFGHLVGDEVLREVAQRIESQVRSSDVAARYGGEEFVILLPDTSLSDGERLAQRVRAAVADSPITLPGGLDLDLTVSIGLAETRPAGDAELKLAGERLLAQADVALYEAKGAGRNAVAIAG
jgi:diguanylate cyclase (GGDEF)-like protein